MKKSEIVWIGCDVSKSKFNVALRLPHVPNPRSAVKQVSNEEFKLTQAGVNGFSGWAFYLIDKVDARTSPMHFVMEATGRYSMELYGYLRNAFPNAIISIESPVRTCNFIKSLKQGNKTDALDAQALMQYGFERNPKPYYELPEEYKNLRELSRQRTALDNQLVAAKLRFEEIKTHKEIAKIQKQVVDAIEKAIKKVEKLISECVEQNFELKEAVYYATSIKGVGFITATTVLAECGPLHLHSSRELSAYSGLASRLHNSGTSVKSSRISRMGSARLRQVLYMSSTVVTRYNAPMKEIHGRLVAKGKKPMQARCVVMRKLLILIRVLVVNKTIYEEDYKKSTFSQNAA